MTDRISEIDWSQRLAAVQLDMDQLWQSDTRLRERPVGDTQAELLKDLVIDQAGRENVLQNYVIAPIPGVRAFTKEQLTRLVVKKSHMFIGKIWMMILEFYDEHKTFQGLSIKKTIEAIRAEIAEKLPSDEFSVRAYDDCLREAWGPAGTSVADKIADEMIAALDEANYQAAMREAYQAFKKGEISQFSTSRKTEEDILRDYVELIVDQLIENDL